MNFKQLYTRVQNLVRDESTGTLAIIKETINLKIKDLLQRGFWKFGLRETTLTMSSATAEYYLPNDVDKILDIRQTESPVQLKRVFSGDFDRLLPNPTATGNPKYYMELVEEQVHGQPTVAAKVIMYSSDNQDVTGESGSTMATLFGVVDGEDRTENIALSATNVLSSVNQFTKLYSITTDIAAVGTLRFTEIAIGTELLELFPNETYRVYRKIKVHPIPNASTTLYLKYQALSRDLVNDSDTSLIPARYADIVVYLAAKDLLLRQGDATQAAAITALGEQGIQRMMKEQDLYWDYVPAMRAQDSGLPYIDSSYPFSYY